MTLTAPSHLRGPLHRFRSSPVSAERGAWIVARRKEGHGTAEIAEALGISHQAVCRVSGLHGYARQRGPGCELERLNRAGIRLGNVGPAFTAMPPEAQDRIASIAAKTGCTIAQAMARLVSESIGAANG